MGASDEENPLSAAGVELRRLGPEDWGVLRQLRLAALADSPGAFASTLERERAFDEETWRSRCRSAFYLVAEAAGRPVGLVAGIVLSGEPPQVSPWDGEAPAGAEHHLVSMWVDPERRRHGIGRRLIEALLAAAREKGVREVDLWVAEGNDAALSAYERAGFERTGERAGLPYSEGACEDKLRIRLS